MSINIQNHKFKVINIHIKNSFVIYSCFTEFSFLFTYNKQFLFNLQWYNLQHNIYRVSLIKSLSRFSRKWLEIGEDIHYQNYRISKGTYFDTLKITKGHQSIYPYVSYNFDNGCLFLSLTVFQKNVVNFLLDSSCTFFKN